LYPRTLNTAHSSHFKQRHDVSLLMTSALARSTALTLDYCTAPTYPIARNTARHQPNRYNFTARTYTIARNIAPAYSS